METDQTSYLIPVYRLELVKESQVQAKSITCPSDLAEQMKDIARADREHLVCLFLNTQNRPVGRQTVSIGSLNQAILVPRELYKAAILSNACKTILIHNHPSGELIPSKEDDLITDRIARAGQLLGIPLLDHVILSPAGRYYSYDEQRPELLRGGDQ